MPERDGYIPGVPCWIDTTHPDPNAAAAFYGGLFGWEFEDVMPPGSEGKYLIARIRGGDVAGIGSVPEGAPPMAVWNTYVQVASADETAAKVKGAGGTTVTEPFDVMDAGRMAVFADPEGAGSAFGSRSSTRAPASSTSTALSISTDWRPATSRRRRRSTGRCSDGGC